METLVPGITIPPPEEWKCNCIWLYRRCITFRRLLFQLYEERCEFSYGHLVGFMSSLVALGDESPARLKRLCSKLWETWGELQPKLAHRPPSDRTLLLYADAVLLSLCPNSYQHLLRDALSLRLNDYPTKTEKLIHLKDCAKWTNVTCSRVWWAAFNTRPQKPSNDWWMRATRCSSVVDRVGVRRRTILY